MPPQQSLLELSDRLDKACGKSFIAEGQKCHQPRTTTISAVGGAIAASAVVYGLRNYDPKVRILLSALGGVGVASVLMYLQKKSKEAQGLAGGISSADPSKDFVTSADFNPKKAKTLPVINGGAFGEIRVDKDTGILYKSPRLGVGGKPIVPKQYRNTQQEIAAQIIAGNLGVAPKILGVKGELVGMEYLSDYVPLAKLSNSDQKKGREAFLKSLAVLHLAGVAHGDRHEFNIMTKKGNPSDVKIIDYGSASINDFDKIVVEILEENKKSAGRHEFEQADANSRKLRKDISSAKTQAEKQKLIFDYYIKTGVIPKQEKRTDKACGKSFIAEGQKCSKTPVARSAKQEPSSEAKNRSLRRNLATAGGIAVMGGVLVGLNLAKDVLDSELPASAKCPSKPPRGLYDTFTPGDLIYTSYEMDGISRAHYGVYLGKDAEGNHSILHTTAKEENGKVVASQVNRQNLDEATKTSFRKAERTKQAGERPSTEQLHKLAQDLNGRNYDWDGFENNCETFARALVNDLPVSLQGQKVSKFNRAITSAIIKGTVGKDWDRKNSLKPKEVADRVKKAMATTKDSQDLLDRLDKACGKSFIAEGQKCSKIPVARSPKKTFAANSNAALTKNLLTAGGLAVTGGLLTGLYRFQEQMKTSSIPPEMANPDWAPAGYYDTLKPGDLLYTTGYALGGHRAHYAVYLGKENGRHTVLHTKTGADGESSLISKELLSDATKTSFKKAERTEKAGTVPTTEQLHKLANELNGKNFDWNGFESNCESFARAVANDIPESLQGQKVDKFNKFIIKGVVYAAFKRKWDKENLVTNQKVWEKVKETMKTDSIALLERLDKKCGQSGISDNEKCSVGMSVGTHLKKVGRDIALGAVGTAALVGGLMAYSKFKKHQAKSAGKKMNPHGLTEDEFSAHDFYKYNKANNYDQKFYENRIKTASSSRDKAYEEENLKYFLLGEKVQNKINKKTDSMLKPTEQAENILRPIFNNRPVKVMSVSLSPEGTPTGVFSGSPVPGKTHYYTFKMGNTVEYKRIGGKMDSARMDLNCNKAKGTEPCGKACRKPANCKKPKDGASAKAGSPEPHPNLQQMQEKLLGKNRKPGEKQRLLEKGLSESLASKNDTPNPFEKYFKSKGDLYAFAFKHGDATKFDLLGIDDRHWRDPIEARKLRNQIARAVHPDLSKHPEANEATDKMNELFSDILDVAQRREVTREKTRATKAANAAKKKNSLDGLTKTHKVLREFKNQTLTSHGKPVTNRKQAIAIALSEQSRVNRKKKRETADAEDPCWEGYEQVGMKRKGKKKVPNCVEKADALLERLDKKCGRGATAEGNQCHKGQGATAAIKKGTSERNQEAWRLKTERWRQKNPKKAFLIGLTLAIGIHVVAHNLEKSIRNGFAEHYIKKDFDVSPQEARRVRKTVQDIYRKEGQRAAENYYNQWAAEARQEQQARCAKDGPPKDIDNNWHKTLGVSPDASGAEIKAAFRKKVKEHHPDNGGKAEEYHKVQEAWESAQATGKFKRGDSLEIEYFLQRLDGGAPYGIWYKNRTTPLVVTASTAEEARSKGSDRRKESYGEIVSVKELKGADAKAARRGDWVRTRASGKSPEESTQKSKIRPQFFDSGCGCKKCEEEDMDEIKKKADALLARLDVKCGKGAISINEKCHSSAVMGAISMGHQAINSIGLEKAVMTHHAVSHDEAKEFGRSLAAVHQKGGADKARDHYVAWAKNVRVLAGKVG